MLEEVTGDFNYTFYVGGGLLALSGILCYPLRYVHTWETRRMENREKYMTDPGITVEVHET
jgi:hypothetical protein